MSNNNTLQQWWKHLGCYDRQQVSNIPYDGNAQDYLQKTDCWWNEQQSEAQQQAFEEFFSEN